MTIPEAAQLVLQAGFYANEREIFVLDMGKPVRIWDLADKMIRLAGLVPGRDIDSKEVDSKLNELKELMGQTDDKLQIKEVLMDMIKE